jgi:hypothetical protein
VRAKRGKGHAAHFHVFAHGRVTSNIRHGFIAQRLVGCALARNGGLSRKLCAACRFYGFASASLGLASGFQSGLSAALLVVASGRALFTSRRSFTAPLIIAGVSGGLLASTVCARILRALVSGRGFL